MTKLEQAKSLLEKLVRDRITGEVRIKISEGGIVRVEQNTVII